MGSWIVRITLSVAALAAGPATAEAVTWDPPVALPAGTFTWPGPVTANAQGDAIAVSSAGKGYGDPPVVRIDTLRRGGDPHTVVKSGWTFVDAASDADGMSVLVRIGERERARLALLRLRFGGSASVAARAPVWSLRTPGAWAGAVSARPAGAITVVWLSEGKSVPRLVRSQDGRRFGTPQPVRGLLTNAERRHGVAGIDLVEDGARTVLALTALTAAPYPTRGRLILATATHRSAFVSRQGIKGPVGVPRLVRASTGRLGLLVEDSGISGGGDCSSDQPRRLWASAREVGATRFRTPQLLLKGLACYQPPHQFVAGPGGRFALAWGIGDWQLSELSTTWLATSSAGAGFSAPEQIGTNVIFTEAGYDADGTLTIAGVRSSLAPGTSDVVEQPLLQLRPAGGPGGTFDPIETEADATRATHTGDLHPVVLHLAPDGRLGLQLGHR
ncbi:MAG: hypothetical protein JHC95_00195 [Solirubrobacteraceae bacterium]|nr:hypothetical protein [Solirubrobacteraceae bacterium]